jgi:pyrroline-5-carboxylate reductase
MLPFLDYSVIRQNPKVFIGYSDSTVTHFAFLISVVATLSLQDVTRLAAPARNVTRAVPLPSAVKRQSPTAIFPRSESAAALFDSLDKTFAVDSEAEFDALSTATATIASHFAFLDCIESWLVRRGVAEVRARGYLAQMFLGLADAATAMPGRSSHALIAEHATPGGINEQILDHLSNMACSILFPKRSMGCSDDPLRDNARLDPDHFEEF